METLKATGVWVAIGFAAGIGWQCSKAVVSFCNGMLEGFHGPLTKYLKKE